MPLAGKIHLLRLLQQVSEVKPLDHWKEIVWRVEGCQQ
jgi:hypothetical protein